MNGETFEEACRLIVETLKSSNGTADVRTIVESLKEKGISRPTTYRALRRLVEIGTIKRTERGLYVLTEKLHALLAEELGRSLCALIRCDNPQALVDDITRELGVEITKIENMHNVFTKESFPSQKQSLGWGDFILSIVDKVLENKALFTLAFIESSKLLTLKKLIDGGCDEVFTGLPESLAGSLKKMVEIYVKGFEGLVKMSVSEVYDPLMKLEKILTRHGYRGVVWIEVMHKSVPVSIEKITVRSLLFTFRGFEKERGIKGAAQCLTALYRISSALTRDGCRSLGRKERKYLIQSCGNLQGL